VVINVIIEIFEINSFKNKFNVLENEFFITMKKYDQINSNSKSIISKSINYLITQSNWSKVTKKILFISAE